MTVGKFLEPGSIERPGAIGRMARIVSGCALLYFLILTLIHHTSYVSLVIPKDPGIWIGVGFSFYFLPDVINVGFTRNWRRWPQLIIFLVALAAVVFDFFQYRSFWGPPLGLLVFALLVYVTAHLGLSFILAGILATPG